MRACMIMLAQYPDEDIRVIFMNTQSSIAGLIMCEVGYSSIFFV